MQTKKKSIKYLIVTSLISMILLVSCGSDEKAFDASGVFEAQEIVISSEVNGVIQTFEAGEGDQLNSGQEIVKIEVTDLEYQKEQIEASIESITDKRNDPGPQIEILEQQLISADASLATLVTQRDVLIKEQTRIHNLFNAKAATQQMKDDIDGKISILDKQILSAETNKKIIMSQINSARRSVAIYNRGILSGKKPLEKQKAQVENRLGKGIVINPVDGTLLTKYAHAGEFVNIGKPLYRIADLKAMELRAYIDGTQLGQIKLGQVIEVYIDQGRDEYREYKGTLSWVSEKAEFTPKSIQTKDERANLVYAIKVKVVNDGLIKIGMYGEVIFTTTEE